MQKKRKSRELQSNSGRRELIVIALGGNALFRRGESGSADEQQRNISNAARHIADLIEMGYRVAITHGNGPQIGATMLRHEAGWKMFKVPPFPMYVCVAETQGFIGYLIQQSLRSELKRRRLDDRAVVTVVTRVIVNKDDPELKNPTKPIGQFMKRNEVKRIQKIHPDYTFVEDKARGGWRRVVPSPDPIRIAIAEQSSIVTLVREGFTVVACGGGGIPTVEEEGWRAKGIEAVIDKDLAAERLATLIGADRLVILTDVDYVYLNYGSRKQKALENITTEEARRYLRAGEFREGSMEPKVLAAVRFVENGGKEAIIADLSDLRQALQGLTGTHIKKVGGLTSSV